MIHCAHGHTGMIGMYNVAGVWGMSGLWKAAADSCHLLCHDLTISSQAFIPLSLIHIHTLTHLHTFTGLHLFCSVSLPLSHSMFLRLDINISTHNVTSHPCTPTHTSRSCRHTLSSLYTVPSTDIRVCLFLCFPYQYTKVQSHTVYGHSLTEPLKCHLVDPLGGIS